MDTQEQVPKTHSPLPWSITNERHGWVTIEDANGNEIINPESNDGLDDPTHFPDLANARLVVTVVNERAELIAALRLIADGEHAMSPCATRYARLDKNADPFKCDCPRSIARALLDKVNKQ